MLDSNDYIHGPDKDYVHRVKHVATRKDHVEVACRVFALPCMIAFVCAVIATQVPLLQSLLSGFVIGYSTQAFLVYSFNAIRSLIKGESRGI
jgi:hypothetical protein